MLLDEACKKGVSSMALTDINFSGACMDFVRLSAKYGIRPVIGIDFRNGAEQKFIGLARNNRGFEELNDYLSIHLHEKCDFPDVIETALPNACIIYPFSNYTGHGLKENEWLGVHATDLNRLVLRQKNIPLEKLVILHTVSFKNKRGFNTHRLLRAIDKNTLLSKLSRLEEGREGDVMLDLDVFKTTYSKFPKAIKNTEVLLEQCQIAFEFGLEQEHKNLKFYTNSEEEDYRMIRSLCNQGLIYRYSQPTDVIYKRLELELNTIRKKGFISYFLINWRITQYAAEKGYFYVGRGSGANSIIAYLLRITDVDPIELDLYFERFINLYRKNPPDFDIDFSWKDRKDITRFIFDEFEHVALIGTHSTFKDRAVVRELGKVFGLPKREIDLLQDKRTQHRRFDSIAGYVKKYSAYIRGLPSHLSVHAGGILIAQNSIHRHTATEMPPKGFPTTQFDMVVAEDIGLYKFDILGQRGLGKIKDCLQIIHENRPEVPSIDIHDIPRFKNDERIKSLLREGKAIGCFYVESPAMRMLLKKLRVDHYLGLVAASSVIRPGVAKSGMMREYILRFRYPERRKEAHPALLEIMPETFGVMVYQEDVIKVAHYFADLDLGEADVLRRGMSGKFRAREEFQSVRDKFFSNCIAMGRGEDTTREVWRQIESFAGYAFAKGHSASYAVESYQSLYLKAHYPLEYMVAVLNNGGGFYQPELYIHEARLNGASIEAPCVNTSMAGTVIQKRVIFLGLVMIKELESNSMESILEARYKGGRFLDLHDFCKRTGLSLEQVSLLIRVGAFRFTGESKKDLLWNAHFLLASKKKRTRMPELFDNKPPELTLPQLNVEEHEDAFDEIELLNFPLSNPFRLMKNEVDGLHNASDLENFLGQKIKVLGYLITVKNTTTSSGKSMHFGTFIDRDGAFLDTVHFPPIAARYPFRGKGIYVIEGSVVEEFGFYTIEVTAMEKQPYVDDPRYTDIPKK